MKWLVIDEQYLNYLRANESRIPNSNYGVNKYKPFFGVLMETEDFYYVTQISHAQPRHVNLTNKLDFVKIYDPQDNRLLAVINLNYMFPIPKIQYQELQYKDIEQHRSFQSDQEKSKYIDLLSKEMVEINKMDLSSRAKKLYELKENKPEHPISQRCFNFKSLETLALNYNNSEE